MPRKALHEAVVAGKFDTGRDLKHFPTQKIEGQRLAVLGYGNIGREVARMAKALWLQGTIYAIPPHQPWIESEGFQYAATPAEAARGAHYLSIHTGLGTLENGRYANQDLVSREILSQLNHGAVVVNYDRGEVIDTAALKEAVTTGKVRHVCVDADLFNEGGKLTGPLVPYIALSKEFPDVFELLPHVAADTDHVSRVEGAQQAIDQILRAIRYHEVVNLRGDLPEGYTSAGSQTVSGVGKVSPERLTAVAATDRIAQLRTLSETLADVWNALAPTPDPARRAEVLKRYSARLVLDSNRYATLMEELGLRGPL